MAKLFLNMFKVNPQKRWSAKVCYSYLKILEQLDSIKLREQINKRDTDQAELNVLNASRRFRRNSEELIVGPVLDAQEEPYPVALRLISKEAPEAVVSNISLKVRKLIYRNIL